MQPGTRVGIYEIVTRIGEGGMGEVYRARDHTLDRNVALKLLPESFASDPDRVMRFEREAKNLAALNHPNIAAVYGVAERAIAMELVEGDDLSQRIAQGPLGLDDAVVVARQIASALEAAHESGIVHRDLKPANIKVRADGTVKVLDFGLAKAFQGDGGAPGQRAAQSSATMTSPALTAMGVILGTAAYMSPEQARGRAVDKRADIWAFGCVLYEMLTGCQPFAGDSMTDVLAAVVKEEPDWTRLPVTTPPALRRLLRRCLEKDPQKRLRDAADARLDLDDARSTTSDDMATPAASRRPGPGGLGALRLVTVALVTGVAAAGAAWMLKPAPPRPVTKFSVHAASGLRIVDASIAPDGSAVAYIADDRVWVQRFDTTEPRVLEGISEVHAIFWSPDSALIGFQSQGQLWKVPASGGTPIPIARVSREFSAAGSAVWLADDRIVFTTGGSGLMEVSARGGEPTVLLEPDPATEVDFHNVSTLPDGRGFLFGPHLLAAGGDPAIDLFDGVNRRRVYEADAPLDLTIYSPTGHILFSKEARLWALPFDIDSGTASGEPFLVAANADRPSLSREGTLATLTSLHDTRNAQMTWVDRRGALLETVGRPGLSLRDVQLSPDGRAAVGRVDAESGSGSDLWILDLEQGTDRRLSYEPGENQSPDWSPDGRTVIYQCGQAICGRPADGTGAPVVLVAEPAARSALSPDGRYLTFTREQPVTSRDVFVVPMTPGDPLAPPTEAPWVIVSAERIQHSLEVAPSGGYAAYASNETGVFTVYLTRFPSGEGKWQVSAGLEPRWSNDGRRLYFVTGDRLMEVDVAMSPTVSISEPRALFSGREAGAVYTTAGAAPAPDGSRFLMSRSLTTAEGTAVTIIQNWFAEFARGSR